jgi:hypothetical protein
MDHILLTPGYTARAARCGGYWLRNLIGPNDGTDLLGEPDGTGVTFRGVGGTDNWFNFPITSLTIFNGVRLTCNLVAVTLDLEATNAFLRSVWVFDRLNNFFQSPPLNVTGDFSNTWSFGQNMFGFPDHLVDGAIGISVNVFFDQDANVKFTGAGARFHD